MTVESYPIHRCIYRNDLPSLKELLKDDDMKKRIDERDNHGNTPIHLALMLDRRNCILTLLNSKCDVFTRNSLGWNPLDEAIMIGDIDIIEKISYLKWRELVTKLSGPGGALESWTSVIPNLYMKYKLRLRTPIPLFQKLGARDVEEIYKKGSSIRFNTTITGIDSRGIPKILKGSISIILKFDETTGIYRITLLDNKKKLFQEFFPNIPQWYLTNSLKSKIGVNSLYKFYFDVSELTVKQKKNSVLRKTKKTFALESGNSFKAELFKTKNVKIIIRKRKDEAIIGECKSDVKTKVSKEDEISTIFKKFEDKSGGSLKNKNYKEEDEDDSDDSDDESTYSDDLSSEHSANINSIFRKYINEENPEETLNNPENIKKINEILEKGCDEMNNKVTNIDMEYLDKFVPSILKEYLSRSKDNKTSKGSPKISYNVSKDGNTKTYEIDGNNDTLDWETAYNMRYPEGNDLLYEMVTGNIKDNVDNSSNGVKPAVDDHKEDIIPENKYFDPSYTEKLHMGRVMRINDEVKTFKNVNRFWMSRENTFPVNLSQLIPLFKFINSVFFDQINQEGETCVEKAMFDCIEQIISNDLQGDKRFPLKIVVPIYPSVKAQFKIADVSVDPSKIPDELFEIPKDYKYGNVYFNNVN